MLISGIRAQAELYLESLAGFASLGTWGKKVLVTDFMRKYLRHYKILMTLLIIPFA